MTEGRDEIERIRGCQDWENFVVEFYNETGFIQFADSLKVEQRVLQITNIDCRVDSWRPQDRM